MTYTHTWGLSHIQGRLLTWSQLVYPIPVMVIASIASMKTLGRRDKEKQREPHPIGRYSHD